MCHSAIEKEQPGAPQSPIMNTSHRPELTQFQTSVLIVKLPVGTRFPFSPDLRPSPASAPLSHQRALPGGRRGMVKNWVRPAGRAFPEARVLALRPASRPS